MYDCSKEVIGYHDDEVTLPQSERDEMRDRRNANRDRLRAGLKKAAKPMPTSAASTGLKLVVSVSMDNSSASDISLSIFSSLLSVSTNS